MIAMDLVIIHIIDVMRHDWLQLDKDLVNNVVKQQLGHVRRHIHLSIVVFCRLIVGGGGGNGGLI